MSGAAECFSAEWDLAPVAGCREAKRIHKRFPSAVASLAYDLHQEEPESLRHYHHIEPLVWFFRQQRNQKCPQEKLGKFLSKPD